MKHSISTFLLTVLLVIFSQGQNAVLSVSGYVYDIQTGTGISNQLVTTEILSGGMVTTYALFTNSTGFYGDSILVFDQGDLVVSTTDCLGDVHSFSDSFGPNNLSFNYDFFICADSIPMGCTAAYTYFLPPVGGTTVFFENLSTGNPGYWFWDFGDGNTSTAWEPIHEFASSGNYQVCLTIMSNDSSCYDSYCENIAVGGSTGDCQNFFWYETWNMIDFAFMGESLPDSADYYHWDFGDGTTGNGQTVLHTYNPDSTGIAVVTLTTYVYDPATGDTCVASSSQEVWIGGSGNECTNWFWYESWDAFTFTFTGEGMPPASGYIWDFGDGSTAFGQEVEHTYAAGSAGQVSVTLTTIHNTAGTADTCIAFSNQVILVGDSLGGCENFFWYLPTGVNSFLFTGQAVPEADSYFWDFGDGQTAFGQEVAHTFDPNLGDVFTVTLTTVGYTPAGDSCLATSQQEVWISNTGWDCENWFWYETWDFTTFNFFGEAFPYPADEFFWDLGDGTTATGPEYTHTYSANPGEIFWVTLTTVGYDPATGDSCLATSVQEVIIGGTAGDCENLFWYVSGNDFTFEFGGESFPMPADLYLWNFGDGSTATGQFVTHTFDPTLGDVFDVCLTTFSFTANGDSCMAESCQPVSLGGQTGAEVFGTVYANNVPIDVALVGLFGADPNAVYYEFTLTQPGTGMYFFGNVPEGDYYIYTTLTPQSANFYDYFPTYYGDASFWSEAELLTFGSPENPYDIHLVPISGNAAGPAIISGTVIMENGKEGPGENITILLMDMEENPLDFAHSNETGAFLFEGLPFGSYKLKVEMPGITSEVALVDLHESNQSAALQFYVNSSSAYLDVSEYLGPITGIGMVYPNPVLSTASLEVNVTAAVEVQVQIIDQTGQVVSSGRSNLSPAEKQLELDTRALKAGLYYLRLIDDQGHSVARKFIK